MQNAPVTPSTTTVRAATEALRDVFTDTGTRWPLDEDGGFADLTTTTGAWDMLTGGYYDQAGIPRSPAFRTMLAGYIVDAATAAEFDYRIDTDEDEHVEASLAVCALIDALMAAADDAFEGAPGFSMTPKIASTERAAALRAFFAGETSEALNDLVTESIIVGVRMIGEEDVAELLAAA